MKTIVRMAILAFFLPFCTSAQVKFKQIDQSSFAKQQINPEIKLPPSYKYNTSSSFQNQTFTVNTSTAIKPAPVKKNGLTITRDKHTGQVIYIEVPQGESQIGPRNNLAPYQASMTFLNSISPILLLDDPAIELKQVKSNLTKDGYEHLYLQQMHQGLKVYGGEMIVHLKGNAVQSVSSRHFPTPDFNEVAPKISDATAYEIALTDVLKSEKIGAAPKGLENLVPSFNDTKELVIYHINQHPDSAVLAWHLHVHPNHGSSWKYFVHAHTGAIIFKYSDLCKLHAPIKNQPLVAGPAKAQAKDLAGNTVTVDTYDAEGTFWLINGAKSMFKSNQSEFPDKTVGTIITVDARNTNPQNDDFQAFYLTSNNNVWSNPTAVSAHVNAGIVYDYYLNTFGRTSINNRGGNIVSFINVNEPDNAFWNGYALYFGNHDEVFKAPVAQSLDVVAHEFTHGVIQNEANLEYVSQSGALNESFADVFGTLIERDNWQMGEAVINKNAFPSGALRDLADPHNGGRSRSDIGRGWQPAHMNEYLTLPETDQGDNGGVHINSGIPNKAFFLFAQSVGLPKAEQVYYDVIANRLVRFSQFIDLRMAVIESARQLYSQTEANAAASAFDQVGITGGSSGEVVVEVEQNTGRSLVVYTDGDKSLLKVNSPDGFFNTATISQTGIISRPSVTDDGTFMVFVDENKTLQFIEFDWTTTGFAQGTLSNEKIWRNAAVSKDGKRLAALLEPADNTIIVFDLTKMDAPNQIFELYNPTYTSGVSTGNVQYADVIEWDLTGEYVMYDAFNEITTTFDPIEYWDIGFVRVWDNSTDAFGDNYIQKLYSGLPENTSIGNPTFAKNSLNIIAFDWLDEFEENYQIVGYDLLTGKSNVIFNNVDLGFPNFSNDDKILSFDAQNTSNQKVIGKLSLSNDKISASGQASVFITDPNQAQWGVWFATGTRILTSANNVSLNGYQLQVSPNPFTSAIHVQVKDLETSKIAAIEVFNLLGQKLMHQQTKGNETLQLDLEQLPGGTFILKVTVDHQSISQKIVKTN